jgi:hypothetical protein
MESKVAMRLAVHGLLVFKVNALKTLSPMTICGNQEGIGVVGLVIGMG